MFQEGGCGLTQNKRALNLYAEAAEFAAEAMQGKLIHKYYEQAEMSALKISNKYANGYTLQRSPIQCEMNFRERALLQLGGLFLYSVLQLDEIFDPAPLQIDAVPFRLSLEIVSPIFASVVLLGCFKQQGFTPELLHIICDRSVSELIRLSAAVCFKNNVHRHWEVTDDDTDDSTDDFYSKPKKDTGPERCLSDEDKALIREHIIDAVCAADEPHRTLLCTAILLILHADFPKNWPDFAEKLTAKILQAPNASTLAVALLIVHRFLKVHKCRYPHYAENQYVFTARNFLTEWAPLAIESSLLIFNAVRNDEYVPGRELIEHVLFPILCYGDVAEDRWREDVEEPIRFRFGKH
ncbi:unnamed protein product [Angiostrongylus costaricensis]|uniref:Importin N-terminal domain-containing protein n=1 Tax=Angiostrongylus costaricensis TaxID=334426 RepID=A0A0R3PDX8_ANGCS|nr:unnamed protein product [Angiostrongylus costaricensis]